jgi:hypothetical protein
MVRSERAPQLRITAASYRGLHWFPGKLSACLLACLSAVAVTYRDNISCVFQSARRIRLSLLRRWTAKRDSLLIRSPG